MSIQRNIPQIKALCLQVEAHRGRQLKTHYDFLELVTEIEKSLRVHISESTLERVWGYSTRGYDTVSLRTLNVLAEHIGYEGWTDFCSKLRETNGSESEMFSLDSISTSDLRTGDYLRIGWLPDRMCVVRYLGSNRFVATDCQNSTMQAGDTFTCLQFAIGQPLYMTNFNAPDDGTSDRCYVAGQKNGLTTLELTDGGSENGKVKGLA